jgi:hypothetical protein
MPSSNARQIRARIRVTEEDTEVSILPENDEGIVLRWWR